MAFGNPQKSAISARDRTRQDTFSHIRGIARTRDTSLSQIGVLLCPDGRLMASQRPVCHAASAPSTILPRELAALPLVEADSAGRPHAPRGAA